ncbi:hypothetical protein [Mycobacterium sp.]|uniref:hypothetical protein n=1 Tax=Mycobacterium sp. TaxID=1785 RepID=UPI003C76D7D9
MDTAQAGSSGPPTPETDTDESNRNVKQSDAGDLDPRDTAHPTGQAQAEKNAENESPG